MYAHMYAYINVDTYTYTYPNKDIKTHTHGRTYKRSYIHKYTNIHK